MPPRVRIDASTRVLLEPVPDWPEAPVPARPSSGAFVELEVQSCFSFLQGASSPAALFEQAQTLGYDALAITDRDGLYGLVRAHEQTERSGVRLITGCELTMGEAPPYTTVVLHVQSSQGYSQLCQLLTESHARHPKGKKRRPDEGVPRNCYAGLPWSSLCRHAEGLWALVAPEAADGATWASLKQAFGSRLSVRTVRHFDGQDAERDAAARAIRQRHGVPLCATNAVRFAKPAGKRVFDVLHCIREGCTLDEAGRALPVNAEAHLKGPQQMAALFGDAPEALARAREIANACTFSLTELRYQFPYQLDAPAFPEETADQALRRLTFEGAAIRYPAGVPEAVSAQVEKELTLIRTRNVAPFFLSVKTIVEMARKRDILCQGRGSAANSAVCYCLGITAVDPTKVNLLFERFLSINRSEPPDIDVDFEHERREEVIQDIYQRYGRERAAMVSEIISYRGKSALRDVGKAFGLSLEQVERLSATCSWWDHLDDLDDARLKLAGFDPDDRRFRQALELAHAIQGYPRHLSIHVGGFVLSALPLHHVAPIEPATMPGRTVVPWDKDDLDTLGFFKVDVLGLGMLSALRRTMAMAQLEGDSAIEQLARIPQEDPAVYDALCQADTVGVFQIESRAQMAMLPRLQPRVFYDLVVQVAIVGPGPIQGKMVHPYLRRRAGEEARDSPHPCLDRILDRTYGVPIFQEQVMQIAIEGAGYTGGEADQLRRDMAAWKRNGNLERHREKLNKGFLARGISAHFAERLYEQMKGFADYGFPESHAASFALLVYASSWLKLHHPAAFAAALINSQPMGFYSPNTILQDAQRHHVEVRPMCVMQSDWDCTLEPGLGGGPALRVGLRQIKGLREESVRRLEAARKQRPFSSTNDLATRSGFAPHDMTALAEAGALEQLEPGRRNAMWKVRRPMNEGLWATQSFPEQAVQFPTLTPPEQLLLDYARTSLSANDHPMRWVRQRLGSHVLNAQRFLVEPTHGTRATTAGMVICRQRPQTASGVVFMTLEDETGFINWVFHPEVFERLRHVATGHGLLLGEGKVEKNKSVVYLVIDTVQPLALLDAAEHALPNASRDFH